MTDVVEKKVEYKVEKKSEAERNLEDAGDKLKAGARAVANKAGVAARDLDRE